MPPILGAKRMLSTGHGRYPASGSGRTPKSRVQTFSALRFRTDRNVCLGGRLIFTGGITGARGHEGDNAGRTCDSFPSFEPAAGGIDDSGIRLLDPGCKLMETLSSCWRKWKQHYSGPSGRAGELFAQSLRQIQARTTISYYVLLIQYPAAVAVALIWSPLAWAGSRSSIHTHLWLAVVFGGLLPALPVYLIRTIPRL